MACCPEGALGRLGTKGYVARGAVERLQDMDLYFVGSGTKCIIWNYDIFGFDSGRTRETADLFAEAGYLVIIPDFFRGTWKDPSGPAPELIQFITEKTQWANLKQDLENIVLPFARSKGATVFSALGTCWGTYMVLKESSYPGFRAGVSWPPSHSLISGLDKEGGERALLSGVSCPQLFMPAQGDHDNTRPGGLGDQLLGAGLEIVEFKEMKHGWTVRGDMEDPAIYREVKRAITLTLEFLNKHL